MKQINRKKCNKTVSILKKSSVLLFVHMIPINTEMYNYDRACHNPNLFRSGASHCSLRLHRNVINELFQPNCGFINC